MKIHYLIALAAAFSTHGFAAENSEQLLQKGSCLACHAVAKKMVGPAYKDIAAKYKNDKGALSMLEGKIRTGGTGNWGALPMPPQKALSDAEIKTLAQWVLNQK
jgi:cytochrome c